MMEFDKEQQPIIDIKGGRNKGRPPEGEFENRAIELGADSLWAQVFDVLASVGFIDCSWEGDSDYDEKYGKIGTHDGNGMQLNSVSRPKPNITNN